MGRVCWGMGTGWIYLTLAIPVPLVWVAGYPPSWWWVFMAEFESRSTIWSLLISLSTTPTTSIQPQQTWQGMFKGKSYVLNPPAISSLTSFILFRSPQHELVATKPLPSNKGCRPHDTDADGFWVGVQLHMGLGQIGNDKGDLWFGRPMRYAGRWTTVSSPPFTYFNHCYWLSQVTPGFHVSLN